MSKHKHISLPPKPEKPAVGECCGRGCERCVYFYYEKALVRWEEKIRELNSTAN